MFNKMNWKPFRKPKKKQSTIELFVELEKTIQKKYAEGLSKHFNSLFEPLGIKVVFTAKKENPYEQARIAYKKAKLK
jgi:hypothetical protein